jgi:hypothetical protein
MSNHQYSIRSLCAAFILTILFVLIAARLDLFHFQPMFSEFVTTIILLAIACAGIYLNSAGYWIFAIAVCFLTATTNLYFIESMKGTWGWGVFQPAGEYHLWLSLISFATGLFALINRISRFYFWETKEKYFKTFIIALLAISFAISFLAAVSSLSNQSTSGPIGSTYCVYCNMVFISFVVFSVIVNAFSSAHGQ